MIPHRKLITARIHRNGDDEDGVLVQMMIVPRIAETVSIQDVEGLERDVRVTGLNHLVKRDEQGFQQTEIVIFCEGLYE